jgi:hypothetical protein
LLILLLLLLLLLQYPANALVHRPALLRHVVEENIKVRGWGVCGWGGGLLRMWL